MTGVVCDVVVQTIKAEADLRYVGSEMAPLEPDDADKEVPDPVPQHHGVEHFTPSHLRAHNFPGGTDLSKAGAEVQPAFEDPLDRNPDLWLYRERTVTLLRRYLRYSLETGRLPSIMGCEFFRTHVTSYGVHTFEDRVVFVHDVEISLRRLDEFSQQVIARMVLQEFGQEKAAVLLHCSRKTIQRALPEALDQLSEVLLEVGLLVALPERGGAAR
jgi:predicted DNA-binding protein (UPF0251 family)